MSFCHGHRHAAGNSYSYFWQIDSGLKRYPTHVGASAFTSVKRRSNFGAVFRATTAHYGVASATPFQKAELMPTRVHAGGVGIKARQWHARQFRPASAERGPTHIYGAIAAAMLARNSSRFFAR
jgi:hypothetical protein